mmetsp:Transcript_28518/g.43771  ORF Transcript_28518/g.43771 Transcript_28518/m.43771 type:complete len:109 (-) Transcript_28518:1358-1684(-)
MYLQSNNSNEWKLIISKGPDDWSRTVSVRFVMTLQYAHALFSLNTLQTQTKMQGNVKGLVTCVFIFFWLLKGMGNRFDMHSKESRLSGRILHRDKKGEARFQPMRALN